MARRRTAPTLLSRAKFLLPRLGARATCFNVRSRVGPFSFPISWSTRRHRRSYPVISSNKPRAPSTRCTAGTIVKPGRILHHMSRRYHPLRRYPGALIHGMVCADVGGLRRTRADACKEYGAVTTSGISVKTCYVQ